MGNSRRFHKEHPRIKCISAQPSSGFHGLEGLKHMPTAIVPGIYDPSVADDNVWIETEDAYEMCRRVAREEALLVGISSGANLVAARAIAKHLVETGQRGVIVTILCDGAYKYLSESFWNDPS
jgi:cysteine synthase B